MIALLAGGRAARGSGRFTGNRVEHAGASRTEGARWWFVPALAGLLAAPALPAAEFTFFSCSDTHYGETAELNADRFAGVELINRLPGTAWPAELGGGPVAEPLGVLVLGDLIDDGAVRELRDAQLAFWLRDFGVNGEGKVRFPVYEGFGNHDLGPERIVQRTIIERNRRRPGLTAVSPNGLHYSWDWQGVHFVQLNLYPGDAWQKESKYGPIHDPEDALEFLKQDLAGHVGGSGRPVILAQHYDPRDDWWLDGEKAAFYSAIKDYNILCLIHGHTGTGVYQWNGIDVVNDGNLAGGGVFVFRVTPDDRLQVGQFTPGHQWRVTFSKNFTWQAPATRGQPPAAQPAALAGPPDETTFLVVSDTHYRIDTLAANHAAVTAMNAIPGTNWPEALGGGTVCAPRGVLHCGDATNDAKPWQWDAFTADYGVNGEGSLRFPVCEICGNHDGGLGGPVGEGIVGRNRRRTGLRATSPNGLHRSWEWNGVHFISLGVRPGGELNPYNPHHSLDFLRSELATRVGDSGAPVVLYQHFGFDPAHSLNWWTDRERDDYHRLIRGHNVIAIFHGHSHDCAFYQWRGIDVFNAPHMRWNPASLGFLVAHLAGDTFRVAERRADGGWGRTFRRKICRAWREGGVPVVVHNGDGPAAVGPVSATLQAGTAWLDPAAGNAEMRIFWGPEDGGTNPAGWAASAVARPAGDGFAVAAGGLRPDTVYHYRAAMKTPAGSDWADFSWQFRTAPAAVVRQPADRTRARMSEAVLAGTLEPGCAAPARVTVHWGRRDGGTNPAGWEHAAEAGTCEPGPFTVAVNGLLPATKYYFRSRAVTPHGEAWAGESASFTTEPAVVVTNGAGAGAIRRDAALLRGELTLVNASPTRVTVYWGEADGGDEPAAWDHSADLGERAAGPFEAAIAGLAPATRYHFRAFARNPAGSAWAASSESFSTARDFSAWRHRMRVRFAGFDQPVPLRDFPALVVLEDARGGFRHGDCALPGGADLRFSDEHGAELDHEIEAWDQGGKSWVWVRVPQLASPATSIVAHWGNPDPALAGESSARHVWSGGFAGVWHMGEPDARDALGRNHGRGTGTITIPGVVSAAQQFAAEGKPVIAVDRVTDELRIAGELSVSAWVKPLGQNDLLGLVTMGEGWGEFNLHLKGGGRPSVELKPFLPDAGSAPVGRDPLAPGQWHHLAATWDGAEARLFVNGREVARAPATGRLEPRSALLRFGAIENRHQPCALDEARISRVARPPAWIAACWNNQSRPGEFCECEPLQ